MKNQNLTLDWIGWNTVPMSDYLKHKRRWGRVKINCYTKTKGWSMESYLMDDKNWKVPCVAHTDTVPRNLGFLKIFCRFQILQSCLRKATAALSGSLKGNGAGQLRASDLGTDEGGSQAAGTTRKGKAAEDEGKGGRMLADAKKSKSTKSKAESKALPSVFPPLTTPQQHTGQLQGQGLRTDWGERRRKGRSQLSA